MQLECRGEKICSKVSLECSYGKVGNKIFVNCKIFRSLWMKKKIIHLHSYSLEDRDVVLWGIRENKNYLVIVSHFLVVSMKVKISDFTLLPWEKNMKAKNCLDHNFCKKN